MKPLVVYLAYEPLGKKYLENFLKFYKKFDSGIEHDLLICFKQFKKEKINDWKKILINKSVDFIEFNDDFEKNDFDIGSYFRVAEKYSDRLILFLNTYTIPVTNNWLKIYLNHYERKTIIGATGSMASLPSQFFNFFFNQHTKLQQIIWGLKHLIHVQLFPNPHIRTTAFFLDAKDFLSLKYNKEKFTKKIETNYFESGRNGISNQLIKRGFKLLIINSDNNKFNINDWKKSETYCLGNQSKLIFKDNRTEEYENADYFEKNKRIKICWGDI